MAFETLKGRLQNRTMLFCRRPFCITCAPNPDLQLKTFAKTGNKAKLIAKAGWTPPEN